MAPVGNERELVVGSVFLRCWLTLPAAAHAEIKTLLVKTQKRESTGAQSGCQKKKNKKKLMRESCEDSQGMQE